MNLKVLCLLITLNIIAIQCISQKTEIGADYGRAWFFYKYKDYGSGLVKAPESNYGKTASISIRKNITRKRFIETGIGFALYEQYYSTRKYWAAWEQNNPVFFIPALIGWQSNKKLGWEVNGGVLIGIMPDQYIGIYEADYIYPRDSITRGTMYRNLHAIFPLLNLNAGIQYRINPDWQVELKISYIEGFLKITEFDFYYNDGSGANDQHGKQWGTGDLASIKLAIRYRLKSH
jgi:hypothetical protein